MKRLLLILAGILYMSNVSAQCQNNYPEASKDGKIILFCSDRTGVYEIYKSDEHGGNVVQLTNTGTGSFYPAITTDAKTVAWQEGSYGLNSEIWIMSIDGSNKTQLTNNTKHDGYPNFSPDGKTIVYEAWDGSNYPEIHTMDLMGGNIKQLTNQTGAYWNSGPIYNPSGTKIYFQKGLNADNQYVSMNADGTGGQTLITPTNNFGYADFALHFSPMGDKIVFSTSEWRGHNDGSDIVKAEPDGKRWNRISTTVSKEYWYWPVFLGDTTTLVYGYSKNVSTTSFELHCYLSGKNIQISNCWAAAVEDVVSDAKLYPNPANNKIVLQLREDFQNVSAVVYDMNGKEIKLVSQMNRGKLTFQVDHLADGMYLINVYSDGNLVSKGRFLVSKL